MTIKDIAELSGYGVGTVSRVLNNHPDVSDKARRIIQATIDKYNFQPNANARSLKSTKQTPIAIVVKGSHNMLFADILEKMQSLFSKYDENVEVSYIDEEANEIQYAIQLCQNQNPKGIVFLGGNLEYFEKNFSQIEVPCVLVTNDASELTFPNLSSFTTHDEEASEKLMDYLIEKGHRKIGVLGGAEIDEIQDRTITISLRRIHGCMNSFRKHQIPFNPEVQFEHCRYSMQDGYDHVKTLLERNPDITAIFAMGDLIAIGAMRALADLGKRVPEDIAIAGYDDIPFAQFVHPRLTTIHQDTEKLARKTVDAILQHITYDYDSVHQKVAYTLVERESV